MLKKLLKYDLAWCYKPLIVFYILAIFFAIVVRIVESFEQSLIVLIIDKICCGIVIAMLFNILINCFMRNWAGFVKRLYGDESYLTHTLPVSKSQIYLSKVLAALITLSTSFLVIVACLMIAILNQETWAALQTSLEQSAIYFDTSVPSFVTVMVVTIFLQFFFMMMCGFLGLILGHRSNNLKIVKSIIIGFAIYTLLSLLSLAILYIAGLGNSDIQSLFNQMTVNASALRGMMLVAIAAYTLYNLGIYFVSDKLLRQGVNVD